MLFGPYPWAYRPLPNTSIPIAEQTEASYFDYLKTKQFEDIGYFLQAYIVSGGVVTLNVQRNDSIDVSDIVVSLNNDVMSRNGATFQAGTPNSTYFLDFTKDGDWSWGNSHPSGTNNIDFLTVSEITTDSNGMVNGITDKRGHVGGFLLKDDYGLQNYATKSELDDAIASVNTKISQIVINAKDYGAVGDGLTNDTSAIQAAIDACPTLGIVWLPPGTYKVVQLNISNRNSITITGPGELKSSADTISVSIKAVISVDNSQNILLDRLNISGMYAGADDRGIWVGDSHNVTIKQCRISNFGQEALYLWGANNSVESTNHVLDNYIIGNNYGIKTAVNGEYWEISRNKIINNNYGIYGALGNCRIDNNKVIQNVYGIMFDGSAGSNPDHSSISNNQINHNRAVGLFVTNLVNGETIAGNEMLSTVGPETWPTTGKSHSLVMVNVKHVRLTNNQIDANTSTSSWIHIDGHTDCKYVNNIFRGGNFKEVSIGLRNVFAFNTYTAPCVLELFAGSSASTIRIGETDDTTFMGKATAVTNKIAVASSDFQNGWTNDAGYYPLSYWKDAEGCVHIQGSIKGGTVTTSVFTLPPDYRPSAAVDVIAIANNTGDIAGFRIYANGSVQQLSGGNTHVSINAMFKP